MKNYTRKIYQFTITIILFTVISSTVSFAQKLNDVIYQYSTKHAFVVRDFDGNLPYPELETHGDFGLGTFNSLDGEMAALDGKFYRIDYKGNVTPAHENDVTPFAAVKFFTTDKKFTVEKRTNLDELKDILLDNFSTELIPTAIKVTGEFAYVKTRSVMQQSKPYPSLEEVIANQSVFEFENVRGTMIGFWFPDYYDGVTFPGFHFHFLTDDLNGGGHLLDCTGNDVTIEFDFAERIILEN